MAPDSPFQRRLKRVLKPFIILALIAILVFDALGIMRPVEELLSHAEATYRIGKYNVSLYDILKGGLLLVVTFWITGWLNRLIDRRLTKLRILHPSSRALLAKIIQILLYVIAGFIALDVMGIDLTTLTVFGGALGIGIGFGLQKIASNFISGLILLMERAVKIDDMIEMADGTSGFVRKSSARYTLIELFNGREMMIPNEDFITGRVTNWTFSSKRGRIDIHIGVSYDADLEQVQKILLDAATEHPRCLRDPAPSCFLRGFGESSVNFMLMFWIGDITTGQYATQSEVLFTIWRKFREAGIQIPYPQREIRIRGNNTMVTGNAG